MAQWHVFTDPRFELRFSYPDPTPLGHAVERTEGQRDGVLRVHFRSRGSRELYWEISKFPGLSPAQEYERHKPVLERQFAGSNFAITDLREGAIAGRLASTYTFTWRDGERIVLLVAIARSTYRILYDPHASLSAQVLATVAFTDTAASYREGASRD